MRYWARISGEIITAVESYSHSLDVEGAVEISKEEYDEFIASLPEPESPEPVRDPLAEIDELKAGQTEINKKLDLLLKK